MGRVRIGLYGIGVVALATWVATLGIQARPTEAAATGSSSSISSTTVSDCADQNGNFIQCPGPVRDPAPNTGGSGAGGQAPSSGQAAVDPPTVVRGAPATGGGGAEPAGPVAGWALAAITVATASAIGLIAPRWARARRRR